MTTSVADETDVSVAFSEQSDSATISVNEDAKSTEQASIKSTSAEALDEKASNVASDVEASEKPSELAEAEEQTNMVSETILNCCTVNYICGTL